MITGLLQTVILIIIILLIEIQGYIHHFVDGLDVSEFFDGTVFISAMNGLMFYFKNVIDAATVVHTFTRYFPLPGVTLGKSGSDLL